MKSPASRRQFLKTASTGAVLALTATSYAKIVGANERISLGLIGRGGRGYDAHMKGVHPHDKQQNVEFTAVSDPWRQHRERAAVRAQQWYGRPARQFVSDSSAGAIKPSKLPKVDTPVAPVEIPDHFLDWLQCLRTRKTTNAPIEAGYYHSVPVIMGALAMDTGKRQIFDPQKREIHAG